MKSEEIERLLSEAFPAKRIRALLKHYSRMLDDFLKEDWEDSIAKSGKFVEAALKTLADHCNVTAGTGRVFKVDGAINSLASLSSGAFDDSIRLTIPRACRFAYDIASNRGGRHDPDEIDPNHMDANVVVNVCAWVLAELIRYANKGAIDHDEVEQLVESLTSRKYPFIEEIDGRIYVHLDKKSARNAALVILARKHPKRVSKKDLVAALENNGFLKSNAKMAVSRIKSLVDNDGSNQIRLLSSGLKEAEKILEKLRA